MSILKGGRKENGGKSREQGYQTWCIRHGKIASTMGFNSTNVLRVQVMSPCFTAYSRGSVSPCSSDDLQYTVRHRVRRRGHFWHFVFIKTVFVVLHVHGEETAIFHFIDAQPVKFLKVSRCLSIRPNFICEARGYCNTQNSTWIVDREVQEWPFRGKRLVTDCIVNRLNSWYWVLLLIFF